MCFIIYFLCSFKVSTTIKQLEEEKVRNSRLNDEVRSHEQRDIHLDKVAKLKKKRIWLVCYLWCYPNHFYVFTLFPASLRIIAYLILKGI